ncbi:unnamed protein product [Mycena citricolor]|uniref:Uncharacterized protein n=1 Tax=Mycena citricolor TaxID=2018698 RepID=A0AAD2HH15_9AGAR|nr:unnamed protein product [Mycena citricolor]
MRREGISHHSARSPELSCLLYGICGSGTDKRRARRMDSSGAHKPRYTHPHHSAPHPCCDALFVVLHQLSSTGQDRTDGPRRGCQPQSRTPMRALQLARIACSHLPIQVTPHSRTLDSVSS